MVHDGPNPECREWVEAFDDHRVLYRESPIRGGFWGHPNRKWLLDEEVTTKWVTWGNADNYYTPAYVDWLKKTGDAHKVDVVVCNIVHNYPNVNGRNDPPYSVLEGGLGINRVDFISFIINTEVMKTVGFNHQQFIGADGMVLEDYKRWCTSQDRDPSWALLPNILAVHN